MRDLVCAKFLTSYDFIFQGLYKMLTRAANYVWLSIGSCKNSVPRILNTTQATERLLAGKNWTYKAEVMISLISVKTNTLQTKIWAIRVTYKFCYALIAYFQILISLFSLFS